MPDAIVIGAGHNGLVAANLLSDAGWEVLVLEAADQPGGAVRTAEVTVPGFRHDLFSAFYPLGAASSVFRDLELERHGLRWRRSPLVVAHPFPDGRCAVLSTDIEETSASLEQFARGDGDGWRRLYGLWERAGRQFVDALFGPFPPLRAGASLVAAVGPRELARFVRFGLLPVRRLAEEHFSGEGGAMLLGGNALHTDLTPEAAGGGLYGWVLCSLGQQVGFPVPEGGAGQLVAALVRRLEGGNGRVVCGSEVTQVVVREGRARGVRTAGGDEIAARHAVLADTGVPALYRQLVGAQHLPARVIEDLEGFQYDAGTVKVDWALDAPIPWAAPDARQAGTVHVADDMDELTLCASQLAMKRVPERPFLVMGQYAAADPSRQPEGAETAWAYTHVPQRITGDAGPDGLTGRWDERETEAFVTRIEARIERLAPGFRQLIRGRHVLTPPLLEQANRNLVGGAVNGGTAQIHQQLLFRPLSSLGRPETPIDGLYLASASAHPGGGVHGAPGANAARSALKAARPVSRLPSLATRALQRAQARGSG